MMYTYLHWLIRQFCSAGNQYNMVNIGNYIPKSDSLNGGGVFLCRLLSVRDRLLLLLLGLVNHPGPCFPCILFHLWRSCINLCTV